MAAPLRPNPPQPPPEHPEMQVPEGLSLHGFPAMGTTITVLLPIAEARIATSVADLFARWEQALTRFVPTSELMELNQRGGSVVIVSPLLFAVLSTAIMAAQATDGIYDPTLLNQLRQAGYDRTFEQVPAQQPAAPTTGSPGGAWHAIRLDAATSSVYLPAGAQIDLGGIAKGMAVDAALDLLRQQGITCALVNAGGDLGVIGLPPCLDHWPVAAPDGTVLRLNRGALATSGIARRHWQQGHAMRHHLIDPRTGTSAQSGLHTVTVVTDRCAQAEIAAKVAFILGPTDGRDFLEQHGLVGALWHTDGSTTLTEGWPKDGG